MFLLGCFFKPEHGLFVIAFYFVAVIVHFAERVLRVGIAFERVCGKLVEVRPELLASKPVAVFFHDTLVFRNEPPLLGNRFFGHVNRFVVFRTLFGIRQNRIRFLDLGELGDDCFVGLACVTLDEFCMRVGYFLVGRPNKHAQNAVQRGLGFAPVGLGLFCPVAHAPFGIRNKFLALRVLLPLIVLGAQNIYFRSQCADLSVKLVDFLLHLPTFVLLQLDLRLIVEIRLTFILFEFLYAQQRFFQFCAQVRAFRFRFARSRLGFFCCRFRFFSRILRLAHGFAVRAAVLAQSFELFFYFLGADLFLRQLPVAVEQLDFQIPAVLFRVGELTF